MAERFKKLTSIKKRLEENEKKEGGIYDMPERKESELSFCNARKITEIEF